MPSSVSSGSKRDSGGMSSTRRDGSHSLAPRLTWLRLICSSRCIVYFPLKSVMAVNHHNPVLRFGLLDYRLHHGLPIGVGALLIVVFRVVAFARPHAHA